MKATCRQKRIAKKLIATQNAPKYRVGKKQGRAILEVATGKEYLLFPVAYNKETVIEYCNWLNYERERNEKYFQKELLKYGTFSFVLGAVAVLEAIYIVPYLYHTFIYTFTK